MKTSELVFVGIKGTVVALSRSTGQQVWSTKLKGYDFVNLVVEGDNVLATCSGEIFCLDAMSGEPLWHNPLKGLGLGLAAIALADKPAGNAALAEKRRRDAQAASSGAAAA